MLRLGAARAGTRRAALALTAFLALLSPWHFPVSSDGTLAFRTAAALAFEGTFALPAAAPGMRSQTYIVLPAPGGGFVTVHAPMSALLRAAVLRCAPLVQPTSLRFASTTKVVGYGAITPPICISIGVSPQHSSSPERTAQVPNAPATTNDEPYPPRTGDRNDDHHADRARADRGD